MHGSVPSEQRGKLINNFADNPESRVFLSTDAGATGLNLQSASTIINLDLPWNPAVLEQRIARIYRLGQQRNVQVINLVSAGTIEEQMLGKLQFKSAMFEGVLDNGADTIFLGEGSRLTQMMDTLGEMIESPGEEQTTSSENEAPKQLVQTEIDFTPAAADETIVTETESPREQVSSADVEDGEPLDGVEGRESLEPATGQPTSPKDLIEQGAAFLSGLAATLKSREATEQLVNSLVHTDEKTGQTTLQIPVKDKQTVRNVLDIVGKLFG